MNTRCTEGERLIKIWRANYDKAVKSNGDWYAAFSDAIYEKHVKGCDQCAEYERNLFAQEQDAEIKRGLDWLADEQDDDNYEMAMGR
jgi:hypothetical protein